MRTHTIWLIFRGTKLPLLRYLKYPFGHVLGLTKDEFNWMVVDPMHFRLYPFIVSSSPKEDLPNQIKRQEDGVIVLKVVIDADYEPVHIFRLSLFTCVSIMKYFLGLKIFAFTPYRLYKKLLKMRDSGNYRSPIVSVEQI